MRNLSIKLYRIYVCYVKYSVRCYPRFHVNAVGLGTYYPRIRGSAYISFNLNIVQIEFCYTSLIFQFKEFEVQVIVHRDKFL